MAPNPTNSTKWATMAPLNNQSKMTISIKIGMIKNAVVVAVEAKI